MFRIEDLGLKILRTGSSSFVLEDLLGWWLGHWGITAFDAVGFWLLKGCNGLGFRGGHLCFERCAAPPPSFAAIAATAGTTSVPCHMGVSEKRGPQYSTPNSRILIIRTLK